MRKKNILIVAYYFPPFREVGGVRVSKLVKYFERFGWELSVIKPKDKYYSENTKDYTAVTNISKNTKIIETEVSTWNLCVKEEGVYWGVYLLKALLKEMKIKKYDYVFYTGGPFMHLWVAPIVKKSTGVEYIVDFRDPWSLSPYVKSKKFKKFANLVEPRVIKNSKYVLNVTDDATKMYKDKYRKMHQGKFITVSNGFDEEDFENINKIDLGIRGKSICYAGKLGEFRDIKTFLNELKRYNLDAKEKVYFIHIGNSEVQIKEFLDRNPEMKEYVIEKGFKKYSETLEIIKSSDYTLIIGGGHPYEPTTKVYDYIALDKKILCINDIDYGYLHEELKKYSAANFFKNSSTEIEKIFSIIRENRKIKWENREKLEYSRRVIFEKFSELL